MAVPHVLNVKAILSQVATDFLLPHPNIVSAVSLDQNVVHPRLINFKSANQYSSEQLHALWNPKMIDATEERINTYLGFINVTHGGKLDGPALVLWPSLMMRGSMWSYQYEYFRKTHRVVLIDSPGINKSDPLRKYIDLHDCAKAVVDILDALNIKKCIFGGNSWGAMLASVIPAYYPERLLGTMVINGTASLPTTPETIMMTLRTEILTLNETVPDWWISVARSAFAGNTAETTNPEFLAYCGVVAQEDPKSIAWALRGILLGRTDTHRILNSIKDVPVLVVAGEEDRQFPVSMCKSMADAIVTSKFVVAPGVAHLASRENPTLINGIIETWLGEIGASGR